MKLNPSTRIGATLNAPPVNTPAPYRSNHTVGIRLQTPWNHNPAVSAAPATSGAARLRKKLRVEAPPHAIPARRALRRIVTSPTTSAIAAAASHVITIRSADGCAAAIPRR